VIAFLRGALVERRAERCVLEAGGVGYAVTVSGATAARLPGEGAEAALLIEESTALYGGGTTLYGFLGREERDLFNLLRGHVPGTGAKKALEMMDKIADVLPDFRRTILDKDARALASLCGFTLKTAEKITASLQGKLEPAVPVPSGAARVPTGEGFDDALQALLALGYREPAARQAAHSARAALGPGARPEDLIRESLHTLSGRA
jgi:Holliday junction DNA helicase RuvA